MEEDLKTRVLDFIKSWGADVSFVELKRHFPEFDGQKDFGLLDKNIVFWSGISDEFADALDQLIREDLITVKPTTSMVYMLDGILIRLPIAKRPKHAYKKPRWLPVVFNVNT